MHIHNCWRRYRGLLEGTEIKNFNNISNWLKNDFLCLNTYNQNTSDWKDEHLVWSWPSIHIIFL